MPQLSPHRPTHHPHLVALIWATLMSLSWANLKEAEKAYQTGQYEKAEMLFRHEAEQKKGTKQYRLRFAEASAAYQQKKFLQASKGFSQSLKDNDPLFQEQAHYNLANSLHSHGEGLFKQALEQKKLSTQASQIREHWQDALDHYGSALNINPENIKASDNLKQTEELIRQLEEELKQEESQKDQENQQNEQDQSDQSEEHQEDQQGDKPQNQEGQQGQDEQKENEDSEGDEGEENPQKPSEENKGSEQNQAQSEQSHGEEDHTQKNGDQNQSNQDGSGDQSDQQDQNPQESSKSQSGSNSPPPSSPPQTQPASALPSPRENESPEEHARRMMSEYSDLGKTPMKRYQYRLPESHKDW